MITTLVSCANNHCEQKTYTLKGTKILFYNKKQIQVATFSYSSNGKESNKKKQNKRAKATKNKHSTFLILDSETQTHHLFHFRMIFFSTIDNCSFPGIRMLRAEMTLGFAWEVSLQSTAFRAGEMSADFEVISENVHQLLVFRHFSLADIALARTDIFPAKFF